MKKELEQGKGLTREQKWNVHCILNGLTDNQQEVLYKNVGAFVSIFGKIRIKRSPWGKGFIVDYPSDTNTDCLNEYKLFPDLQYLNGWLEGVVQCAVDDAFHTDAPKDTEKENEEISLEKTENMLCGFVWCQGFKNFSVLETDALSKEDREKIEEILAKYDTEGTSTSGVWNERFSELFRTEY